MLAALSCIDSITQLRMGGDALPSGRGESLAKFLFRTFHREIGSRFSSNHKFLPLQLPSSRQDRLGFGFLVFASGDKASVFVFSRSAFV